MMNIMTDSSFQNVDSHAEEMKLVFMHLPKTAGTTIHRKLKGQFSDSDVCPDRFNTLQKYKIEELDKWKYFSGHFSFNSIDRIPGNKQMVTVLRNPMDRIVSLYNYWKSHTDEHTEKHGLAGPAIAKSHTLEQFLACETSGLAHNIDNVYVRAFSGKMQLPKIATLPESKQKEVLNMAIRNIERFKYVGCLENPKRSIKNLLDALEVPNSDEIPVENSVKSKKLPPHLEPVKLAKADEYHTEKAEDMIFLDRVLYEMYA